MRAWLTRWGVTKFGPMWGVLVTLAYHGSSDGASGPWLGADPPLGASHPYDGSVTRLLGSGRTLQLSKVFYAMGLGDPWWAHLLVPYALVFYYSHE